MYQIFTRFSKHKNVLNQFDMYIKKKNSRSIIPSLSLLENVLTVEFIGTLFLSIKARLFTYFISLQAVFADTKKFHTSKYYKN